MQLLIISHTEHYLQDDQVYGWGATVQEIDHLATLFDQVKHLAFLYPVLPPSNALPYTASNVSLIPVQSSGGGTLLAKIGVLLAVPIYWWKLSKALKTADVVHVRCPANISMLAIVLLAFRKHPRVRWIKYAGNWQPQRREAWSYTFQRWWLKRDFPRASVTVNGNWPHQPVHVHSFLNPSLTEEERQCAATLAKQKQINDTLKMIFAGRVESAKGIETTLKILARLHQDGISATLDIAGDGPERIAFEQMAIDMNLRGTVHFHGWVPRTQMGLLYADEHVILLPTTASEGWPKVLSEAMAHGVVPVASDVSSIGQYLRQFSVGRAIPPGDLDGFVAAIKFYLRNRKSWKAESERGMMVAGNFTYEAYLNAVKNMLNIP